MAELGLKYDPTVLANDQAFVVVNHNDADKQFIYSNHYSSHASVTTMTRNATKLATLFVRSGSIDRLDKLPDRTRVDVVLHALDATFADKNNNFAFDQGEERKGFGLAAAVTRTTTAADKTEGRVFVVPCVDTFADTYVRFQGNPYFWLDIVSWLRDVKDPVLPTVSEEDVRITHKRDEDAIWFYSTTFGAPALVALAGFLGVRRRKRS
jgi:hypothetical protein